MSDKSRLRVWHIPQLGACRPFYVDVKDVDEAVKVLQVLAIYDVFQFENKIKPDYCNSQGLEEFDEETKEWCDYYTIDGYSIDDIK